MKNLLVSLTISTLLAISSAHAQIDTRGLTEEQKAQLALQAAQLKNQNEGIGTGISKLNPEKLNEWVELGKNAGMAITAMAKELGIAADKFLESNTGKIAAVLIVWKVAGKDILGVVGGTIAWIVLANIILWSFRYFHMKKKVVNKKEGTVEYISRYEFVTKDGRLASAIIHVGAFVVTTLVCGLIIF